MKRSAYILAALVALSAWADEWTFVWTPSPSASAAGYLLVASTNTFNGTNHRAAQLSADVGTNLTATVQTTNAGPWFFAAAAYDSNRVVGPLSAELMIAPPPAPESVSIVIQRAPTVDSTNWQDVGFFRLKIK